MPSTLDAVRQQLTIFMNGGEYMPLWRVVMNATTTIDADPAVSEDDMEWFDELYDAVYMGAEDPVDAESLRLGIVGAAELREQIREMRLDRFTTPE